MPWCAGRRAASVASCSRIASRCARPAAQRLQRPRALEQSHVASVSGDDQPVGLHRGQRQQVGERALPPHARALSGSGHARSSSATVLDGARCWAVESDAAAANGPLVAR